VSFNHTLRYIDDVLSINNHNFHNYDHLIYLDELEIKGITESDKSISYLNILLNIDPNDRLKTSLCDKRDDFDFAIVNFSFLCSNIPLSPAYGVCTSPSSFDTQEHVLRMRTFQNEANNLQKSLFVYLFIATGTIFQLSDGCHHYR
jgi:hypothetical protein